MVGPLYNGHLGDRNGGGSCKEVLFTNYVFTLNRVLQVETRVKLCPLWRGGCSWWLVCRDNVVRRRKS